MPKTLENLDSPIYSYRLSSADMRHAEIAEREIFLRVDPQAGLIFQGEISGSRPTSFIDLSQILLEFAMSCEGCREKGVASAAVTRFGKQLGETLAIKTHETYASLSQMEKLSNAFKCILTSMNVAFIEEIKEGHLEYSLDCCPLSECSRRTGLYRSVEMAWLSFVSLCESLVMELAPNWVLVQPSEGDTDIPIRKIIIDGSLTKCIS